MSTARQCSAKVVKNGSVSQCGNLYTVGKGCHVHPEGTATTGRIGTPQSYGSLPRQDSTRDFEAEYEYFTQEALQKARESRVEVDPTPSQVVKQRRLRFEETFHAQQQFHEARLREFRADLIETRRSVRKRMKRITKLFRGQ